MDEGFINYYLQSSSWANGHWICSFRSSHCLQCTWCRLFLQFCLPQHACINELVFILIFFLFYFNLMDSMYHLHLKLPSFVFYGLILTHILRLSKIRYLGYTNTTKCTDIFQNFILLGE